LNDKHASPNIGELNSPPDRTREAAVEIAADIAGGEDHSEAYSERKASRP
jgi:hypothetical protein